MKLGLGTAQFGSDYGITNRRGKVPADEIESLLRLAADSGVRVIDTAAVYGESEAALGQALWRRHPFSIVTKCLPVQGERIGVEDAQRVRDGFLRSLEKLRQPAVYGLLIHQPADLGKPGAELLAKELLDLKRQGLVSRLGASFYGAEEIVHASAVMKLDIAQMPVSIADQRLVADGTLQRLHSAGTEVHARSVFLQGVLVAERVPAELAERAAPLQRIAAHARAAGVSRLALALGFVAGISEIDVVIVGATTRAELQEIIAALRDAARVGDVSHLAVQDEEILNPSRWPKAGVPSGA